MSNIAKKRKVVADGVFFAELNAFLSRELGQDGYAGAEVRVTPKRTEIIIRATNTNSVLGPNNRRIRELTSLVQQRFNFPPDNVELYAEQVRNRGLSAMAQAESLRFKLVSGVAVRKACYAIMRQVMESEAKGVEVVISGKLRGQRAKSMKFTDGYMIRSGEASRRYVDYAVRDILLKQGILGIRISIMLDYDPTGKKGCSMRFPDKIEINQPKGDEQVSEPQAIPSQHQQNIVNVPNANVVNQDVENNA
jgi:small subunit ribosomal protein S3e